MPEAAVILKVGLGLGCFTSVAMLAVSQYM